MSKAIFNKMSRREFITYAAATSALLAGGCTTLGRLSPEAGPKSNLPVVIIGGGLGGLSAGAVFAQQGFPVTLIERHDRPGGYATSFDRGAGKFTFDVSLHATAGSQTGSMREMFKDCGILEDVEMVELPELCRIKTPDIDMIWPQKNPKELIRRISEFFPDESSGVEGFINKMTDVFKESEQPFNINSIWDQVCFPITNKRMWATRNKTLDEVLDQYTKNNRLRKLLSTFWPYYGLPPSRLSGFYYAVATGGMIENGCYYVKSRSQQLSNALMESIESKGGQVLLDTEVEAITVEAEKVTGVRTHSGRFFPAKIIVSNASVPETIKMLPAEVRGQEAASSVKKYIDRLGTYRPSLSSFIVWLGLNQEIRNQVNGYEIFVDNETQSSDEVYQGFLNCDPHRSGFSVTIYDNAFEGYSKPGTSTVGITMLSGYEPWRGFEADYLNGNKNAYYKKKEEITETLIDLAEKNVIPGLRRMIEIKEAATPLTNLRYTNNPEGAIYGYDQTLNNAFIDRIGNRTPFEGLYLASAWGGLGGGYYPCIASGRMAYQALVHDLGI